MFWQNLDVCGIYFLFHLWLFFLANMQSNAAVMLQFEDVAVKNYLFWKYRCIFWWTISICSIKYFWSLWSFSFEIYIFTKILFKKNSHRSKILNWTIWYFTPSNSHIFQKLIIFYRKVFKLQCYSSVILHVSKKKTISVVIRVPGKVFGGRDGRGDWSKPSNRRSIQSNQGSNQSNQSNKWFYQSTLWSNHSNRCYNQDNRWFSV